MALCRGFVNHKSFFLSITRVLLFAELCHKKILPKICQKYKILNKIKIIVNIFVLALIVSMGDIIVFISKRLKYRQNPFGLGLNQSRFWGSGIGIGKKMMKTD